jgi:uncharacterized membrane protein YdbT with pleckstrin-like domain
MNKPVSTTPSAPAVASTPPEKILFETQPLILPTILSLENLVIFGFSFVIAIMAVVFHLGLGELLIIAALYLLIAFPSFRAIFRAGSTSYVLTNRRLVIFTFGFGPKERSIPLSQIQDVKIQHSGLQRVYGAGNIIVYPKGLSRPVRLQGLQEVRKRAEQIQQAMKKV